jgi:hypothetical protein
MELLIVVKKAIDNTMAIKKILIEITLHHA